jgi:hypothetical protein
MQRERPVDVAGVFLKRRQDLAGRSQGCGLRPPEFEHGNGADFSSLGCVLGKAWGSAALARRRCAGLLPTGARLVKAFGTLSAPTLSAAAWREPERVVQFYATDDDAAGDMVADLIRADGYEPVRVGGLDQSIRIEAFGELHEIGALGRTVTKSEAIKAI